MALMYQYESWTIETGDYVPSGRYGTREAIAARFPNHRIIDAPPVDVAEKDLDTDWPGFARRGFNPEAVSFMDSSDGVPKPRPQRSR